MDAVTARAQANQKREAARQHKRDAASHRRQAKEEMQALAELESFCDTAGIELIFEPDSGDGTPLGTDAVQDIAREVHEALVHTSNTQARSQSDDSSRRTPEAHHS
jgi:hypothetical protein